MCSVCVASMIILETLVGFVAVIPGHMPLPRAVIKFDFGPLVVNLVTSSMYFLCKILNSMVFGLMTKIFKSVKIFETGLNVFARPKHHQIKYFA